MRLLIAEDEKVVRESICRLIDWKSYGIELIGACADGIEAYDMIVDEYPDIVLTDIRMPGLDGLGLIERACGMDRGIEFIILSGYSEFEYAKTAMRFGVREYLLKPCDKEQIIEAIKGASGEIMKRRELRRIQQEQEQLSDQFRAAIRRQFTIEAVTGKDGFPSLMERYNKLLEFPAGEYHLYYISFLEEPVLPDFVAAIHGIGERFGFSFCFNLLYVKNTVMMMLSMPEEADKSGFERFLDNLRLVGTEVEISWWEEPYDTVQQMLEALVRRIQRYNRIILADDTGNFQEIYNYVTAFRAVEDTERALEGIADLVSAREILTPLFTTTEDIELARMLAMRLVAQYSSQLRLLFALNISGFLARLYGSTDITEIRDLTLEEFARLLEERERRDVTHKSFVSRAMGYVCDNLDDPQLSVKWIAENYLYMNVDYFSRQFVKETSEKFSVYLNRMRMEKAKELILQYDSDRIYKVAEQVGCGHNPQYFSQLFKKWTGLTPSQYRENHKQ